MTLRASLRDAGARLRTHPELLALGVVLTVLQVVLTGVVAATTRLLLPGSGHSLDSIFPLVSLFLVLPLFVALYELALTPDADESATASLRRAGRTAVVRYPRVFATDAAVAVASGAVGVFVAVFAFVAGTGVRYARYLASDSHPPHAFETLYLLAGAALVGGIAASFLFRFADALVAFEEYGTVDAVAGSAATAWANRRPLAGFAAVLLAIRVLPLAFFSLLALVPVGDLLLSLPTGNPAASTPSSASATPPGLSDVSLAVVLVASVLVNGVALTLGATLHATFFGRHVAPEPGRQRVTLRDVVPSWSAGRWTVAVVLVVALVAGAATVRTLDLGVHSPGDPQTLEGEGPDEAVAIAARNTASRSHRQVLYMRNASNQSGSYGVFTRSGIDYADRQLYVYFRRGDGVEFGGYFSDGTMALLRSGGEFDGVGTYQRPNWTVTPIPAWGVVDGGESIRNSVIPRGPTDGWRVVSSNESTLVVRVSDTESVLTALDGQSYAGMQPPLADESHLTAYVDRNRGVLRAVRFHLHSTETRQNVEYRLVYEGVGTTDLRRPEPIRERTLAEHLWDALYY